MLLELEKKSKPGSIAMSPYKRTVNVSWVTCSALFQEEYDSNSNGIKKWGKGDQKHGKVL